LQLERDGHFIAELEKKPTLYPDLHLDYRAFTVLSASRRSSMAVAPIPISEILAYARYHYITDQVQREIFLRRIKILDGVFLDWHKKHFDSDKES
jgi:hypothetical protein